MKFDLKKVFKFLLNNIINIIYGLLVAFGLFILICSFNWDNIPCGLAEFLYVDIYVRRLVHIGYFYLFLLVSVCWVIKNSIKNKKKGIMKSIVFFIVSFIFIEFVLILDNIAEYNYNKIYTYNGWENNWRKPILYLYPKEETKVRVDFEDESKLVTTYPKFKDEWKVSAKPNGDLDVDGKYYYALYWDEKMDENIKFDEGFYVDKDNAISFLEDKLSYIGLNDREKNEFIMYWLPILEENEHNLVKFILTDERQEQNELIIEPKPDSLLRVSIVIEKVDGKVNIKEQQLERFNRNGFVAVEWGGIVLEQ